MWLPVEHCWWFWVLVATVGAWKSLEKVWNFVSAVAANPAPGYLYIVCERLSWEVSNVFFCLHNPLFIFVVLVYSARNKHSECIPIEPRRIFSTCRWGICAVCFLMKKKKDGRLHRNWLPSLWLGALVTKNAIDPRAGNMTTQNAVKPVLSNHPKV